MKRNAKDEEFELEYLKYINSLPKVEVSMHDIFDIESHPYPLWEEINGEMRIVNKQALSEFMRNTPPGTCIYVFTT